MRHYTKLPLEKTVIFRAYVQDVELLRAAAAQKEISQSDFIRMALREKAGHVLAGVDSSGLGGDRKTDQVRGGYDFDRRAGRNKRSPRA